MKPIPVSTKLQILTRLNFTQKISRKILESEVRIFNNLISKIQKNPKKDPRNGEVNFRKKHEKNEK